MDKKIRVGVLALQGAFHLHRCHLEALGAEYVEVIQSQQLRTVDGLILPGGESSAMLKLIDAVGLEADLQSFFCSKPVWGICAGAILMASSVLNPIQRSFGAVDIEIERNAYGSQIDSFEEFINGYKVSYIRAPRVLRVGSGINILSKRGEFPTWLESNRMMITTFHPELNRDAPSPWHRRFVEKTFLRV